MATTTTRRRSRVSTRVLTPAYPVHVEYHHCKTYGHAWDEYNPPRSDGWHVPAFDRIALRCVRCTATRHTYIDEWGQPVTRHRYWWPPGYKTVRGDQPVSKAALRLMLHGHSTRGVS